MSLPANSDQLAKLAKLLGVKNPAKMGTSTNAYTKAPPKKRLNFSGTRQEAKQNAQADARDVDAYLHRRAEENRERRLADLKRQSGDVRRFLKTLAAVEMDAECVGYRDCDVDLVGLAEELNLRAVEGSSLRLLLSNETHEWIIRLARRRGLKRQDYFDSADYFSPPGGTALDELNRYLELT